MGMVLVLMTVMVVVLVLVLVIVLVMIVVVLMVETMRVMRLWFAEAHSVEEGVVRASGKSRPPTRLWSRRGGR